MASFESLYSSAFAHNGVSTGRDQQNAILEAANAAHYQRACDPTAKIRVAQAELERQQNAEMYYLTHPSPMARIDGTYQSSTL